MTHIGRRTQVALGEQFASGNGVAPEYGLKYSELAWQEQVETVKDQDATGIIDQVHGSTVVKRWMEGTLTGIVRTKSIGKVLKAHFGQVTTTGPADSAYTHVYTRSNSNTHTQYTMFENSPVSNVRFINTQVGTLNIDYVDGDYIRYTANVIGRSSVANPHSVTYSTEDTFRPKDATIKIAAEESGNLAGASTFKAREIHLVLEKPLEPRYVLGDNDVDETYNTYYKVSGSFVIDYSAVTHINSMKDADTKSLGVYLTQSDVTIGTGTNPSLNLLLSQISIDSVEKSRGVDDIETLTVNFTAEYNLTDARTVQATLVNDETDYDVVATS